MALGTRQWLLSLIVACMTASFTFAQDPGAGGLEIASANGKFAAMLGNQIKITTEDKQEFFVVFNKETNVRYEGTADPKFLMQGLMIRFSSQITQTGAAASPLKAVEIFTPSQDRRLSPEQIREQTPGVYQEGGEVGEAPQNVPVTPVRPEPKKPAAKKTDPKSKDKNAQKPVVDPVNYRVVGQLLGNQGTKYFVQAGGVRIQFELDADAVISVTSNEYSFVQLGDEVKVSGLRTAGQEKYIQAESLQIKGSKPLGLVEAKAAKSSRSSRSTRGKPDAKDEAAKVDATKTGTTKPDASKPDPKKPAPKS